MKSLAVTSVMKFLLASNDSITLFFDSKGTKLLNPLSPILLSLISIRLIDSFIIRHSPNIKVH